MLSIQNPKKVISDHPKQKIIQIMTDYQKKIVSIGSFIN